MTIRTPAGVASTEKVRRADSLPTLAELKAQREAEEAAEAAGGIAVPLLSCSQDLPMLPNC